MFRATTNGFIEHNTQRKTTPTRTEFTEQTIVVPVRPLLEKEMYPLETPPRIMCVVPQSKIMVLRWPVPVLPQVKGFSGSSFCESNLASRQETCTTRYHTRLGDGIELVSVFFCGVGPESMALSTRLGDSWCTFLPRLPRFDICPIPPPLSQARQHRSVLSDQ